MSPQSTDLHLFSTPGPGDSMDWVVDACRPYLERRGDSSIAYLPLATLYAERLREQTERSFDGVGRLDTINAETMQLDAMEAVLRRAAIAYIPDGNAFLLNHRLHISRLFPHLQKKLLNGLPLAASGAGTIECGPDILASDDLNMIPTSYFDGLRLTPLNLHVHYDEDPRTDERLIDYRAFHGNPIVLMEDGAYIRVNAKAARLVRGRAWVWHAGRDKERIEEGSEIPIYAEERNARKLTPKHI